MNVTYGFSPSSGTEVLDYLCQLATHQIMSPYRLEASSWWGFPFSLTNISALDAFCSLFSHVSPFFPFSSSSSEAHSNTTTSPFDNVKIDHPCGRTRTCSTDGRDLNFEWAENDLLSGLGDSMPKMARVKGDRE